ncbi:serine protease [Belliella sp. R4-6]|uniref:Serine protease n=2 Tax=Belliella alkalica TaxID=1730871 RepID=A0ABS9V926_9BACT|nr:trypsin-like peptidase domain-containing protein [Belliella alkalica]MCH7412921.1 serine protease [Belliella alkalica]
MFVDAISKVSGFTRAIHSISRNYKSQKIIPGAATLFFVNEHGYAITCKHVVQWISSGTPLNNNYKAFKQDCSRVPRDGKYKQTLKNLEVKYKLLENSTIQMKSTFIDCIDKISGFTYHLHPEYDLAIIKFNDFSKTLYHGHAVFPKNADSINQGKFLCRLGFPFPEFSNFKLNLESDDIEWTSDGVKSSPRFPIDGMVTRFLGDKKGVKHGIEMSTPGLRGQSGGPLFDENGIVYGMQSRTKHLHLGFDIEDKEIISKGKSKKINDYSFIHLGECIHVNIIKEFLTLHKVKFTEQ